MSTEQNGIQVAREELNLWRFIVTSGVQGPVRDFWNFEGFWLGGFDSSGGEGGRC